MSNNLGPISSYSNVLVQKTSTHFNQNTKFHQLMRNGSETIHSVVILVESIAAALKEGFDAFVNSKAVNKLNEKVLIPASQKILEGKDRARAKVISVYNYYTN